MQEIVMMYKEDLVDLLRSIKTETGILTTTDVMNRYSVSERTLNNYHEEGLRYIKGRPNKYLIKDLEDFFKTKRI